MASPHLLGCACGIDIHAHVVPEHFPAYLGRTVPSPWPSTEAAPDAHGLCHRRVMVGGRHYRTVSEKCWSPRRRLADLPEMGLAAQVVSPMPELLSYWLDAADAQPLIRYLNEQTAALCAESGGRLLGLAAVPLQDVDAAIAELRHAAQTLGLVGSNSAATSTTPRWRIPVSTPSTKPAQRSTCRSSSTR